MHSHAATGGNRKSELIDAMHHAAVVVDRDAVKTDGCLAVVSVGEARHVIEGHPRVGVAAAIGLGVDRVVTGDRAVPASDDGEAVDNLVLLIHDPHGHQGLVVDDAPTGLAVHRALGDVLGLGAAGGRDRLLDLARRYRDRGLADFGRRRGTRRGRCISCGQRLGCAEGQHSGKQTASGDAGRDGSGEAHNEQTTGFYRCPRG